MADLPTSEWGSSPARAIRPGTAVSDKDALRVLRTADGSEALTMATVHVFTDARNAIPEGSVDLDVSTANLANLRAAIVNSIPCMPVVCVCACACR